MPVFNKHHSGIPHDSVYIGRGSKWGNPFIMGKDGDRNEVCEKYEQYLWDALQANQVTKEELVAELWGKNLVCFCAPLRCHGHTLEKAANWAFAQLNP